MYKNESDPFKVPPSETLPDFALSSDDYIKDETTNLMMAAPTEETCRDNEGFSCQGRLLYCVCCNDNDDDKAKTRVMNDIEVRQYERNTMVLERHNHKVNRCLARYSPRATTTSQHTNRAPNEPAMDKNANFGPNWVVFGQKILFYWRNQKFCYPHNGKPT